MSLDTAILVAAGHDSPPTDNTVAWFAFGIAVLGLVWSIVNSILRWPHLHAEVTKSVTVSVGGIASVSAGAPTAVAVPPTDAERYGGDVFNLTALNTGSEAATVWDVGLRLKSGAYEVGVLNLRANHHTIKGPELPARIEPHGTLTWHLDYDATKEFTAGDPLAAWVSYYRPVHWWHPKNASPYKRRLSTRVNNR